MTHAWCSDSARDAAVRAAEDERTGPLPTLAEAIAAPFGCTACGGFGMDHRCRESCEECDGSGRAMFPKSVSASSASDHENKGVRMTKSDRQAADYRAEAIARPFAEAAERSSTVSKSGEGQSGMREQRVSLSLKRMGELIEERDAAIRERDALKARVAELEGCSWVPKAERDALQARVAALEIKLEAASGGGEQPRGWLTEEEHDIIAGIANNDEYTEEGQNIARGLLARSSPPEVVLPTVFSISLLGDRLLVEAQVKKALAAAGVAVKEVGRD